MKNINTNKKDYIILAGFYAITISSSLIFITN